MDSPLDAYISAHFRIFRQRLVASRRDVTRISKTFPWRDITRQVKGNEPSGVKAQGNEQ
jgi:hypothetical protein